MSTVTTTICDCGEQHADIAAAFTLSVEGMHPSGRWDVCPDLLERILSVLPKEDREVQRLRAALAKRERVASERAEAAARLAVIEAEDAVRRIAEDAAIKDAEAGAP